MCDLRKQDKPDPRLAVSCEQQCRKREMDVKILTWDQRGFIYRVREHACWEGGLQDRESRSRQRGLSYMAEEAFQTHERTFGLYQILT